MSIRRVVIIGFGGFAREVAWLIREINQASNSPQFQLVGHVISKLEPETRLEGGLLGDLSWLEKNRNQWDALILGTGTPESRARLPRDLEKSLGPLDWPTLIHPNVLFDRKSSSIERGVLICANVVGTVNLKIREFALINLSCTLGHESDIGAACVLNPSVNVSGGVEIGRETLIGTGAQILQVLKVGEGVSIGAGAVVTKDVASGQTVVGIPAKPLNIR
ncbi:MAG: hypothetical protein COT73_02110 [Bdellovibrio sp. CG10_big_fil_rev_8_21_14_0_10_47_8]|nr:MAG: hypothetical protein COT73_02110 [Bdellovibrio sp. CG10_big_fil_rev_8_21_14_0_10_47_8]